MWDMREKRKLRMLTQEFWFENLKKNNNNNCAIYFCHGENISRGSKFGGKNQDIYNGKVDTGLRESVFCL